MDTVQTLGQEFIEHYGIPGMKWGVRRRSSGTPSTKGRVGRTTYRKTPHRLSDSELNKRIKRLEMEKKYHELNAPIKSHGQDYVHSLLKESGKVLTVGALGGAVSFFLKRALTKKFPLPKS